MLKDFEQGSWAKGTPEKVFVKTLRRVVPVEILLM